MKRFFDLAMAIPSVIILMSVFVLIGFFVRMKIGSPILFKQALPGLHGRPFTNYKFRTMTAEPAGSYFFNHFNPSSTDLNLAES